jgi:single-stranded-DNA-specific exonuclease
MVKRWRIHPHDSDCIAFLQRAAGVPAVVAQLLVCRGVTDPNQARRFLQTKLADLRDPNELPGCRCAAERIFAAAKAGRRIVIYGDYDVDGMTGTALLRQCLKLLGANVGYYLPNRMEEGYGLNCDAVRRLAAEKAEMIVTVDCGVTSVEEAKTARECGVELIVSDHHEPGPILPDAAAIVHPCLPGASYPFAGLSGSGVAMKLAWAICQQASGARKVSTAMRDFLLHAVGMAALGTVADVVPLVDENRVLVRYGLDSLRLHASPGMAALLKVAQLDAKPKLDAEDIGFALAPRLNAAGRLGQAPLAVELLITDRPDRAKELAEYVDRLNQSRQTLERSIQLAASKQAKENCDPANDAALVLADRGWHPGVLGIVAGRLAEKHHRPVVLISFDSMGVKPGVGSARSIPGFNLHAALEACSEHLVSHGGHAAAAGLRIDESNLAAFRSAFCEYAAEAISDDLRTAELSIDAESTLSAFTLQVVDQMEQLAPFGQGNVRPLLCASGVKLVDPPRPLGATGRHLSMQLEQHGVVLRAVAFGGGDRIEEFQAAPGPLDVAFRPVINSFRGRRSVELHLVDWRPVSC